MLITCPECELQVSDKASACPHCGYPMTGGQKRKPRSKNNKRRRLPNGFGQISEIKNRNLRNPFRAMVTVGKDENGRPVCKPLKPESYFPTYNDAYAALVEYNRNPYDLSTGMTIKELYEEWSPQYFDAITTETAASMEIAWRFCSSIYNMRVKEVRARHIKGCIYEGVSKIRGVETTAKPYMQNKIKTLFNLMLDYAVEYDLVEKNYARVFQLSGDAFEDFDQVERGHFPFTPDEIVTLWANYETNSTIPIILIQCYSGWRPQELMLISLENVDLENWTFKSGLKTASGRDRTVPIHPRIRNLVKAQYESSKAKGVDWLFTDCKKNGTRKLNRMDYRRYLELFGKVVKDFKLDPRHRPHDPRVHFVTEAKKAKVDEYAIKYMVGHKIKDITEKFYTKREMSWLQEEISKIP